MSVLPSRPDLAAAPHIRQHLSFTQWTNDMIWSLGSGTEPSCPWTRIRNINVTITVTSWFLKLFSRPNWSTFLLKTVALIQIHVPNNTIFSNSSKELSPSENEEELFAQSSVAHSSFRECSDSSDENCNLEVFVWSWGPVSNEPCDWLGKAQFSLFLWPYGRRSEESIIFLPGVLNFDKSKLKWTLD